MESTQIPEATLEALPQAEAVALARRAAAARGLTWPMAAREAPVVAGFTADITSHPGLEQVVWATIGKQSILAVFAGGKLVATDTALGQILRVQPVTLPGLPHLALMVDDRNDQMVGAFLVEERRRIEVWDGRGLRSIYQGVLSSEQYHHARWDNPRGPAVWQLDRMRGDILLRGIILTEKLQQEHLEAPGSPQESIPPADAFKVKTEESSERRLQWDARLRRFEPL